MAAARKKSAARSRPAKPDGDGGQTPAEQSRPVRALHVVVGEDGEIELRQAGVSIVEAPTVLRLAAVMVERRLGIRE